jgi:hypothetical protein
MANSSRYILGADAGDVIRCLRDDRGCFPAGINAEAARLTASPAGQDRFNHQVFRTSRTFNARALGLNGF